MASSAFGACSGNACGDIRFGYDDDCYKTTNLGKRKVKVWLGVFGFELLPNQTKSLVLNGKCVQVYAGGEKADYLDSPPGNIGSGGLSPKPGLDTMFPRPDPGRKIHFVVLPPLERESRKKIQLIIGLQTQVDQCSKYWIRGSLAEDKAQIGGKSYPYYSVEGVEVGSNIVDCFIVGDDGVFRNPPMVQKVLYLGGIAQQLYKSDFPLVVYTPINFVVKYKVLTPSNGGWTESNEILVPEK